MPNPRIEQLHRDYQGHRQMVRFGLVAALVFVAISLFWDSTWSLLTAAIALFLGFGIWASLKASWACKRELRHLQLIDAQHVHGQPNAFVDVPPANPESSADNFWGQR